MSKSSVSKLRLKVLSKSAERVFVYVSEFQTERALTLEALADNVSAISNVNSNSLRDDYNVCVVWYCRMT